MIYIYIYKDINKYNKYIYMYKYIYTNNYKYTDMLIIYCVSIYNSKYV